MKYKLNLLINKMEKIFFYRRDNGDIPLLSKLSMPIFIILLIVSFQNCRPKIERNILEFLNFFSRTNSAVNPINLNYPVTILDFTINASIITQTPTFSGASIVSCVSSPSLPLGLILNNTTCEITGTPTVIQAAINYTITASDSNLSTASANISITISANPPSVLTYANNPFSFKIGQAVSNQIPTYTGTIVNCSVPSGPFLPPGLTIDNSCIISGTPTATQAATNHTILASNAFGSTNSTINITVVDVPHLHKTLRLQIRLPHLVDLLRIVRLILLYQLDYLLAELHVQLVEHRRQHKFRLPILLLRQIYMGQLILRSIFLFKFHHHRH